MIKCQNKFAIPKTFHPTSPSFKVTFIFKSDLMVDTLDSTILFVTYLVTQYYVTGVTYLIKLYKYNINMVKISTSV